MSDLDDLANAARMPLRRPADNAIYWGSQSTASRAKDGSAAQTVLIVCIAMFIVAAALILLPKDGWGNADSAQSLPSARVDALSMIREYAENEVAADQNYKGQIIDVTGTASKVGRDLRDRAYVILGSTPSSFRTVQCFVSRENERSAARIRPGAKVQVRGQCDGLFGNVLINNCEIISAEPP